MYMFDNRNRRVWPKNQLYLFIYFPLVILVWDNFYLSSVIVQEQIDVWTTGMISLEIYLDAISCGWLISVYYFCNSVIGL